MLQEERNRSVDFNLGELLGRLDVSDKSNFRKLERLNEKLEKLKIGLQFNKTCLKEGLLPKFTNINLHDPSAQTQRFTFEYRKKLVQHQIDSGSDKLNTLEGQICELTSELNDSISDSILRNRIFTILDHLKENVRALSTSTAIRKLNDLYKGNVLLPDQQTSFMNLSSHPLTLPQQQLLSFGTKCHLKSKFNSTQKHLELEILYDSLLKLQSNNIIDINPNLKHQLKSEATKSRDYHKSNLLTREQRTAANELKNHPDIIVRKADKSNIFIVLDRQEYKTKLDSIISDTSKFQRITRNPINSLKIEVNKLIAAANSSNNTKIIKPIIGEFTPGYLYGNVKIHKTGNPLRPIISQVTTPIYHTAKQLNAIITPYLPAKYQINSTDDFLHILRATRPHGTLASLDVESLFTNVPVFPTIEIICNAVYSHPILSPPPFERNILKKLLTACTTKCPFTHIDGNLYLQKDGVSMGSPLGVAFANFYMTHLENKVFEENPAIKPSVYCRYVDDTFIVVDSIDSIIQIKNQFQSHSVLKFTHEIGIGNKLNFLDVSVDTSGPELATSVYQKPTHAGIYLNYNSECPQRYKDGTIKALIHRTYKISSSWSHFQNSVNILKQSLVNNNYPNRNFDHILNSYINKIFRQDPAPETNVTHTIFYKNQFSFNYKIDERIIKEIVYNNTKCTKSSEKLNLVIYYRSNTVTNLVMKNNSSPPLPPLKQTNLIYEYTCPIGDCELQKHSYIGMTTTTLSRRLTMHLASGAPKLHSQDDHQTTLTREMLVNNTKIIDKQTDFSRLKILEALLIMKHKPILNGQNTGTDRILKLTYDLYNT